MVQDWSSKNKKRRERHVNSLKRGAQHSITAHYQHGGWGKDWEVPGLGHTLPWNEAGIKERRGSRFLWQTVISCIFLFFTYVALQSHSPAMKPVESFVYDAMTREFNFAGCADLYNKYVGNMPSVLPAFSNKISSKQSMISWKVPVQGKIVLPYDPQRRGIVIHTAPSTQVAASADGWVLFAGYKKGLGNTVIIRHADEHETWYGWLNSLDVKENDWVKSGKEIGDVSLTKGQPLLYFAVKKDQQFINPCGVIRFNE